MITVSLVRQICIILLSAELDAHSKSVYKLLIGVSILSDQGTELKVGVDPR